MRFLSLIFLLSSLLFSTTITNHNIYKQDDSIDLMLTFSEPYLGKISKKDDGKSTILMLENLKLDESITEKIDSNIIQEIEILPFKNQTFIKVASKRPYNIQASKTVDNYGLRIRVKPTNIKSLQTNKLITKQNSDISGSFLKVIIVLSLLLGVLYLIKRWLLNKNQLSGSWLFHKDPNKKQDIKVIQQKALDTKNRVALLEYNGIDYLVILGNNNIILDKFKHNQKDADREFDKLLNQNGQKLDKLLKSEKATI